MRMSITAGWIVAAMLAAVCGPLRAAAGEIPLTLAEAVDIALAKNPALAAAEGRESGAWAARDGASAERWPQVQLTSRLAHTSEVPVSQIPGYPPVPLAEEDAWITTASLQQLLFSGGRVSALVRQAESGAEAARMASLRTRQVTAYNAERAFRRLLAAQELTGVAAKNLAAAEDHLRVARQRFEARVAARFDVLRAEVQAEEARQEVILVEGGLLVSRALLLQALGLAAGDYRAVAPPRVDEARPGVDELLVQAGLLRPDLRELERQVAAAEEGVAAARAERAPTVGVAADYQLVDPESEMVFSHWTVGAYLSLPVLDGGRIAAHRQGAEAGLVQARAALESLRRQVEAEVRQATTHAASADAQVLVAQRRVEQAEELSRLADVRFAGGVGTATEVADAQASTARARYVLVLAESERGVAAAELSLAVGSTRAEGPRATQPPPAAEKGAP